MKVGLGRGRLRKHGACVLCSKDARRDSKRCVPLRNRMSRESRVIYMIFDK